MISNSGSVFLLHTSSFVFYSPYQARAGYLRLPMSQLGSDPALEHKPPRGVCESHPTRTRTPPLYRTCVRRFGFRSNPRAKIRAPTVYATSAHLKDENPGSIYLLAHLQLLAISNKRKIRKRKIKNETQNPKVKETPKNPLGGRKWQLF